MRAFCVGTFLFVAACSSSEERASTQRLRELRVDARLAVEAQLRDPSSAEFTDLAVYRGADGSERVCGYVNSNNGFGGKAGPKPFVAGNGKAAILGVESAEVMALLWKQSCVTQVTE